MQDISHDHEPQIALIEERATFAINAARALEIAGYQVQCYAHVKEMAKDFLNTIPDIILLDSEQAQHFDAWGVASQLYELGCLTIMYTSHADALCEVGLTLRGRAFAGGIAKPCLPCDLVHLVDLLWQRHVRLHKD
jgi:DNA-binding response OmpR family regulator